ncbi:MAG: KamA family radical SAM protein [Synechococcaceae cyanobacterium SM2_3_1]|nr:KamA family radical SAM protein [Synechococcaceae cyanobacterium SM2_3_1]
MHTFQGTPRPAIWADIPDATWHDWQWQLGQRLSSREQLAQILDLTAEEIAGLEADSKFHVDITPYFSSLMDPIDPNCPVRRQIIPLGRELEAFEGMRADSLAEDQHSPVPGLVHRYPDRVLMLVTIHCASYCRFCTRSRIVGDPGMAFRRDELEAQLDYLRRTPEVRDVLLSGGDPLTLSTPLLNYLLEQLRSIEHIEVIRIGSRVPAFLPQRITTDLCQMLRQYHPLWINVHFNHPKEITPEAGQALAALADSGVVLGNQTVLLAGINDSVEIQKTLVHKLVRHRVRPYYLYQCDLVRGAGHFRTTVARGLEIMEGLRGHTSGYAVPTYVVDLPDGGGKVPVQPQYMISQSPGKVVLRNYEGLIVAYDEPLDYRPDMISPTPGPEHISSGQSGVLGLLHNQRSSLKPEGFDLVHKRDGVEHRLNNDPEKWQPYRSPSPRAQDEGLTASSAS